MKIKKISDIIPLIEEGNTLVYIARKIKKSNATIYRYIAILRKEGYEIDLKKGRPFNKI